MRNKLLQPNIDNSDPINFPDGRIKNNDGSGNGTAVNEQTKGDIHEFFDKIMRLYGITHNGLPDSEANGYQTIEAVRALASKNDFVLSITSTSGVLNVPVKLSSMLTNEQIVCKVMIDKSTETEIKGSDNSQFVVSFVGDFKANEYVRLIKNASTVTIVRLVDLVNLDLSVSEFLYLKKANQTQENVGTVDTVATTPLTNKTVFARRVNGVDSDDYLATPSQNGLLSLEDKAIIDGIGASPIKNIGFASGIDVGNMTISASLSVGGNISAATVTFNSAGLTVFRCTMSNAMTNTNYKVKTDIQSQGGFDNDSRILSPLFQPISTTQFDVGIRESSGSTGNIKMHFDVVQL